MTTLYSHSEEGFTSQFYGSVINGDVVIEGTEEGAKVQFYSDGRISEHHYKLVIPKQSVEQLCALFKMNWSPDSFFSELIKRFGGGNICSAISAYLKNAGLKYDFDMSSRQ